MIWGPDTPDQVFIKCRDNTFVKFNEIYLPFGRMPVNDFLRKVLKKKSSKGTNFRLL